MRTTDTAPAPDPVQATELDALGYRREGAANGPGAAAVNRQEERARFAPAHVNPGGDGRTAQPLQVGEDRPPELLLDVTDPLRDRHHVRVLHGPSAEEIGAREVLELHTVGVGAGYSEAMVKSAARLLTGFGGARPEAATAVGREG